MHDGMITPDAAALLIQPLPARDATGQEAIRFGGKPRLPATLDWPQETYFLAEIDFARLADASDPDGMLPAHPRRGSAFLFLRLLNDGLYEHDGAVVLYTSEDTAVLPERDPPEALPDLREQEVWGLEHDFLSECGRLLPAQAAKVIATTGPKAANPLATNLLDAAGQDVTGRRDAHARHEAAITKALSDPAAPTAAEVAYAKREIPEDFWHFNAEFQDRHVGWHFIFDWAKAFHLECHDMALEHLAEMKAAKAQPLLARYHGWLVKRRRARVAAVAFDTGEAPGSWTVAVGPAPLDAPFDAQARALMSLTRNRTGTVPPEIRAAFSHVLVEIKRHYETTGKDGYNLGPRNSVLDRIARGHDRHAGDTFVSAKDAFRAACEAALTRDGNTPLSAAERLERKNRDAAREKEYHRKSAHQFSLGHMPVQMFGHGFEIQHAVTENADKVLLLQLGDPDNGLPINFQGDGILQLWLPPEDLAAGRFDRVLSTLDFT